MGGPAEPHEPTGEGAGRPRRDDDDDFGFEDPAFRAFEDGPDYSGDAGYTGDAGYSADAGYSRDAGYGDSGEYEPPTFTAPATDPATNRAALAASQ